MNTTSRTRRALAGLLLAAGVLLIAAAVGFVGGTIPVRAQGGDPASPLTPSGDDSYCLICHAQPGSAVTLPGGEVLSLAVPPQAVPASVHGASSPDGPMGCVDCHGDYAYPHQYALPTDLRSFRMQASAVCVTCHQEQRSVPDHANLFHGTHHQPLSEGDLNAPTCVDCHSAHDVQPPDVLQPEITPRCATCHAPEQDLCGSCHEEILTRWQSGVHAIAFERDTFLADWESRGQPADCLTCHTTDYHPETGTYLAEDVTCTACHGYYPAGHPPAGVQVAPEPQMCGDCHVVTFAEWEASPHAFTEEMGPIGCAVCHEPHGQQVRFENVVDLCVQCHQDPLEDYAHTSHLDVRDLTCVNCHMHAITEGADETQLAALVPPDHDIAGHRMTVEPEACNACHQDLQQRLAAFEDIGDTGQLVQERDALQAQVAELEAQIAERQAPPEEPPVTYTQLTQGLILGLGLSITIGLVLLRRGAGRRKNGAPPGGKR